MPAISTAQNRWAHAAAAGQIAGTPPAVGREFINDTPGLPERVENGKAVKRNALIQHLKRRKARG